MAKPPFRARRAVNGDDEWMAAVGVLTTNWAMLEWFIDSYLSFLVRHPEMQQAGDAVTSLQITFNHRMDLLRRCGQTIPALGPHKGMIDTMVSDLKIARHN